MPARAARALVVAVAALAALAPAALAAAPPAATSLGHRLGHYFSRGSTIALLGVLVVCSLLLFALRRRAVRAARGARSRVADERERTR